MGPEDGLDKKAEAHEAKGNTCVFFAWDGMTRGMLAFGDRVREKAEETVAPPPRERDRSLAGFRRRRVDDRSGRPVGGDQALEGASAAGREGRADQRPCRTGDAAWR